MDTSVVLEKFAHHIQKHLKNETLKLLPKQRCQALCAGKRCKNNALCKGNRLCKKHKDYVIREVEQTVYHSHIPGRVSAECPACVLQQTQNVCTEC